MKSSLDEYREFYNSELKKMRKEMFLMGAGGAAITLFILYVFVMEMNARQYLSAACSVFGLAACFYSYYKWFPRMIGCYKAIKECFEKLEEMFIQKEGQ